MGKIGHKKAQKVAKRELKKMEDEVRLKTHVFSYDAKRVALT
jgi:hypothetical protein